MSDSDEIHHLDKEPPIVACLMHKAKASVKTYTLDENSDWAGVRYGLCSKCTRMLRECPIYQLDIEEEVDRRLRNLKGEQGSAT